MSQSIIFSSSTHTSSCSVGFCILYTYLEVQHSLLCFKHISSVGIGHRFMSEPDPSRRIDSINEVMFGSYGQTNNYVRVKDASAQQSHKWEIKSVLWSYPAFYFFVGVGFWFICLFVFHLCFLHVGLHSKCKGFWTGKRLGFFLFFFFALCLSNR